MRTAETSPTAGDRARIALGLLRVTFGSLGLLVPRRLAGRVDGVTPSGPAAVYAFRMFGIRTVLIGRDLLREDGPERRQAVLVAPLIHAADTLTAAGLTLSGQVPRRTGVPLVAVSGLNTVLALLARRGLRP